MYRESSEDRAKDGGWALNLKNAVAEVGVGGGRREPR